MTDEQIKHMVDRFLNWRLPESFNPDGGIVFHPIGNPGTPHAYTREPSGTNLLDAVQADAMVRHMIDGMPELMPDEMTDERLQQLLDLLRHREDGALFNGILVYEVRAMASELLRLRCAIQDETRGIVAGYSNRVQQYVDVSIAAGKRFGSDSGL